MHGHEEDLWISAYNILPPVSPVAYMHMRPGFDAAFVTDAHVHAQWQSVLAAVHPPPRFEVASPAPRVHIATSVPAAAPLPRVEQTRAACRLSDSVLPFEDETLPLARAPRMHARSVANFVRDMLHTHNELLHDAPQYFSLGEVAQYFNNFIVDVHNDGPYTCEQISAMSHVPVLNILRLWTFRPGVQRFTRKQVASALKMTPTEVLLAYHALGFKTWVL
jgi:hypothetical protein